MMRQVGFHPAARRELLEAADFYDLESAGLGSALIDSVDRSLSHIRQFPDAAPVLRGPARKALVAGFPYSLIYTTLEDDVLIVALAHHRRRPFYWQDRV